MWPSARKRADRNALRRAQRRSRLRSGCTRRCVCHCAGSEERFVFTARLRRKIDGRVKVCRRHGIFTGESGRARVERRACHPRRQESERNFGSCGSETVGCTRAGPGGVATLASVVPLHHDTRERQHASHRQSQRPRHECPTEPPRDVSSQSLQPGLRRAR